MLGGRYDYKADDPDELSICEGDVITVTEVDDDGWAMGVLNGRKGQFPVSYVTFDDDEQACGVVRSRALPRAQVGARIGCTTVDGLGLGVN